MKSSRFWSRATARERSIPATLRAIAAVEATLDELRTVAEECLFLLGDTTAVDARIERLLEALGRPQDRLPPVVHVAGTNGKGSTIAYLRAFLEAAGKRVHVFTSPHLVRFNERIRLAGKLVESGQLHQSGGSWVGWEASQLELPPTVRDAIRQRLGRLTPAARQVAELVAVMGGRARYDVLMDITELTEPELGRHHAQVRPHTSTSVRSFCFVVSPTCWAAR